MLAPGTPVAPGERPLKLRPPKPWGCAVFGPPPLLWESQAVTRFILRRLLSSVAVILIIITVSLWLTRQAPRDRKSVV